MAEKTKKQAPAPELFKIHSLVRDVSTRLHRARAPMRHRFKMMLGGGLVRLVRKRPAIVTKSVLTRLLPELIERERQGMLKVTNMTDQRLDLTTLEVTEERQPEPPLPNPPLDSAERDHKYPVGEAMPNIEGGVPETAELPKPEALQRELPEGEDELEPEEEETTSKDLPDGESEEPETDPEPRVKRKRGRRR